MRLRAMTMADIPAGLLLNQSAGWNQTAADWERFLVSKAVKRRSQQNARQVVGRVRRVFTACGFEKLDDIGPSAVHEFIAKLGREAIPTGNRNRAKKLGPATLNKYIRHTQQFMTHLQHHHSASSDLITRYDCAPPAWHQEGAAAAGALVQLLHGRRDGDAGSLQDFAGMPRQLAPQ